MENNEVITIENTQPNLRTNDNNDITDAKTI